MILALAVRLVCARTPDLPFGAVGQVGMKTVPVLKESNPDVYSFFAGGGAVAPAGRIACVNVAGVDYRRFFDVEIITGTGAQRELLGAGTYVVRGRKLLLTNSQARALGASPFALRRRETLPAPQTVQYLDDGKRLQVWTAPHEQDRMSHNPVFTERVIGLVPSDEKKRGALPCIAERTGPHLANFAAPWRRVHGGVVFDTIEAREHKGKVLLERVRFDLVRGYINRRLVARIPITLGTVSLQLTSCSIDGSCAVLYRSGTRRLEAGLPPDWKQPVYLWRSGGLSGPFAAWGAWVWRDRFIGYDQAPQSMAPKAITVVELTPAGVRTLAPGWEWLATSPDGSKVLAVNHASGKPYLLTFK